MEFVSWKGGSDERTQPTAPHSKKRAYVEASEDVLQAALGAFDPPLVFLVAQCPADFAARGEPCHAILDIHELPVNEFVVNSLKNPRLLLCAPYW